MPDTPVVYVAWRSAPGGVADIFAVYASKAEALADPVVGAQRRRAGGSRPRGWSVRSPRTKAPTNPTDSRADIDHEHQHQRQRAEHQNEQQRVDHGARSLNASAEIPAASCTYAPIVL
jgi:hypothetical protein